MTETTKETTPVHEVAIVGAGPIGLELAAHLKRAGMNYVHLEKGQIGQTISWFPRQMHFFSSNDRIAIAGLPIQNTDQSKATREEYLAYLRHVVLAWGLEVNTFETVTEISPDENTFLLRTTSAGGEQSYRAGSVVLATGGMHGPRLLDIPGEDLPHVSHYFEEPHRYFQKDLLIVGGRNSAVEAALRCYHAGAHVILSYRRTAFIPESVKYWLLPELEGRIQRGEITAHLGTTPRAISPTEVTLADQAGANFDVAADFVLLLTGYRTETGLLQQAGAKLADETGAPVFDPQTMQTTVPNLYVAGTTIAGTQGRFKVFIENCHVHAERILAAITGAPPPPEPDEQILPES